MFCATASLQTALVGCCGLRTPGVKEKVKVPAGQTRAYAKTARDVRRRRRRRRCCWSVAHMFAIAISLRNREAPAVLAVAALRMATRRHACTHDSSGTRAHTTRLVRILTASHGVRHALLQRRKSWASRCVSTRHCKAFHFRMLARCQLHIQINALNIHRGTYTHTHSNNY